MMLYYDQDQGITFNRYDDFAALNNVNEVTTNFTARLSAIPGRALTLGQFNASVVVKITERKTKVKADTDQPARCAGIFEWLYPARLYCC